MIYNTRTQKFVDNVGAIWDMNYIPFNINYRKL